MTGMAPKSFLFVSRRAAPGSALATEMLDAALIAASFDQHVHLAFLDDGVFQLVNGVCPPLLGQKDLAETLSDLADYDIEAVWVERESLAERGLKDTDLAINATVVDRARLTELMSGIEVVIGA